MQSKRLSNKHLKQVMLKTELVDFCKIRGEDLTIDKKAATLLEGSGRCRLFGFQTTTWDLLGVPWSHWGSMELSRRRARRNFARLCGMLVVHKGLVIEREVDVSMSTYLSRSCARQH